jgi:CDGSH-type Zn-finger protein
MIGTEESKKAKKIFVLCDGPYRVEGDIPLVRKTQVVSEYGEPLTWKSEGRMETRSSYSLCRCGKSNKKPFCDDAHLEYDFDGTETADTRETAQRQEVYPGGVHIVVKRDNPICCGSGFCGNRVTDIKKMTPQTDDPQVRAQVMAMIERCPSGSFAYSLEEGGADIEPDYPQQAALTTEITSEGPINGPLWVSGNIPIQRSDGKPFETRNRVTLCTCGLSKNKPLCDGTHRNAETKRLRGE